MLLLSPTSLDDVFLGSTFYSFIGSIYLSFQRCLSEALTSLEVGSWEDSDSSLTVMLSPLLCRDLWVPPSPSSSF